MSPRFGRLPLLSRRRGRPDPAQAAGQAVARSAAAQEVETLSPVLLPAMIFHQVLFDATETTPAWLASRPAPRPAPDRAASAVVDEGPVVSAAAPDEPRPAKRPRRSKANGPSDAKAAGTRAASTTRRPRKAPRDS